MPCENGCFSPEQAQSFSIAIAFYGIILLSLVCVILYAILVNIEAKSKSKKIQQNIPRKVIASILRITIASIIIGYALYILPSLLMR